jgi:hypothetical protein
MVQDDKFVKSFVRSNLPINIAKISEYQLSAMNILDKACNPIENF